MTNKYWNHDNPFLPGTVVRADEANDKFDGIEVGFDRIEGITDAMALQIKADVMAEVQPKLDAHEAQVRYDFNNLKGTTQGELQAFKALLSALDADMRDRLSKVIVMPDGVNNLVIPGYSNGNEIPYIDGNGNAALLKVPDVAIPADWAKVYLGRQTRPPGTDLNGDPLREGAMFYNESLQRLEIYRNGQWEPGFISGSGVVFVGNIQPASPKQGDLWFDTQTADLMLWYDDGTSSEWVVINSNYNALFGPGIGPILQDGTVPMRAPLELSGDAPGPLDAISRTFLEDYLRMLGGPGTILAPRITSGVDPRSHFPVQPGTANLDKAYDVRIPGTILFFGNYGALHADYNLGSEAVIPGDFVISTGREWVLIQTGGGGFVTAADLSQPMTHPTSDLVSQDFFTHNGGSNVQVHPSWLGAGGAVVNPGDTVIWDGSSFHVVPELRNLDRFLLRDGSMPMEGGLLMGGHRVARMGDPVDPQDAVNLRFLQTFATSQPVAWAQIAGLPATFPPTIGTTATEAAAGDHLHDGRYFQKTEHVNTSAGAADAGKPVVLGAIGRLPISMLSLPSVLEYKGTAAPGALPASPQTGDVVIFNAAGTQSGVSVHPGDWALFDGAIWEIVPAIQDLSGYVNRDGSTPMLADFNAGGFKILNVAAPTADADAANKKYVDDQLAAAAVPWAQVTGKPATFPPTIGTTATEAAAGNHLHDGRYFQKTEFVDATAGVADAGKPVMLDATGHIPAAMVPLPATSQFLLLDGTRPMTGDLDAGSNKLVDVADATVDTDGVNLRTLHAESYQKTEHVSTSAGAADAGKPIVLGATGRIPIDMLSLPSVLEYKGTAAPGGMPANPQTGDMVIFSAAGTQGGVSVHPGDWALFDGAIWEIVPAIQDLSAYVNRDGSTPMSADFNAGGFKILNVAAPTADADAANKKYVDDQLAATAAVSWAQVTGKPATFAPIVGTGATDAAPGDHTHNGLLSGLTANRLMIASAADAAKTGALQSNAAGDRLGIGVVPAQALHVGGQIIATDDITAFFSDMRLKEDLAKLPDALDRIDRIEAFTYRPNQRALTLGAAKDARQRVGVSAQDVQRELPEAVSRAPFDMAEDGTSLSGEDYLTVDYAKLVPLLVQGMQDLRKEVRLLKAQIEELKNA